MCFSFRCRCFALFILVRRIHITEANCWYTDVDVSAQGTLTLVEALKKEYVISKKYRIGQTMKKIKILSVLR